MNTCGIIRSNIRRVKTLKWVLDVKVHSHSAKPLTTPLLLFDPSINSLNLGDAIIAHYCDRVFAELFDTQKALRISTHQYPTQDDLASITGAELKIVCGSNLLSPHFEEFSNWKMPRNLSGYRNIITLGVGWGCYCETTSKISKFVYNTILNKKTLHSVRDGYTEQKFREMGITNVINTGCPSLWALTPNRCAQIPTKKARRVITTVTDYAQDSLADQYMLDTLNRNYEEVYIWIQGTKDQSYLGSLTIPDSVHIIERDIDLYTAALGMGDVDYVGTRLHAGIHAMNQGVRSIIIAVDNRASEMGKDFNLPIIPREEIPQKLQGKINSLWKTDIHLPMRAIETWKAQFRR